MKIFILYCLNNLLNYNKQLMIEQFKRQYNIYKNNNFIITFIPFDDYEKFYDSLYEKIISEEKNYINSIFWMHLKVGSYALAIKKYTDLFLKLNIKSIFWMDDLHFAKENIDFDERYIYTDLIISPSSVYFEQMRSHYMNKTEFLFYYFDENLIDKYNPTKTFSTRKNKILLTGNITQLYSSRIQMLQNAKYNDHLYDVLEHPGYYNMTHNYYHEQYFDKLAEYKGSIVGLADAPLDFLLGKVVEVIGSGCVGFFEKSPLYKKQLGLEAWIHYIPLERDKHGKLIFENISYADIINSADGKRIAMRAYRHIKKNYNSLTCANKIINILKNRFS